MGDRLMTSRIRWLHIADLHVLASEQWQRWHRVRTEFYGDLEDLCKRTGGWDLVLVTGDLTQQGNRKEFNELSSTLQKITEKLASLGSNIAVLAVPGNHDLVRPKPLAPETIALKSWHDDSMADLREMFWSDEGETNQYRQAIESAFMNYTAWWKVHCQQLPAWVTIKNGLLPGDFSATIEQKGVRLGIVGLNTAFLQLTRDACRDGLELGERQLYAVCDDPSDWYARHDAVLLMTHHPLELLHPRARQWWQHQIHRRHGTVVHLSGHAHGEPQVDIRSRYLQCASLCAFDPPGKGTRINGYIGAQIEFDSTAGKITAWPRRLHEGTANTPRKFIPDYSLELNEDQAIVGEFLRPPGRTVVLPVWDPLSIVQGFTSLGWHTSLDSNSDIKATDLSGVVTTFSRSHIPKDRFRFHILKASLGDGDFEVPLERLKVDDQKASHLPVLIVCADPHSAPLIARWSVLDPEAPGPVVVSPRQIFGPKTMGEMIGAIRNTRRRPGAGVVEGELLAPLQGSLRDEAKMYYCRELLQQPVKHPLGPIEFTWAGWRHITRPGRSAALVAQSLSLLPCLRKVLDGNATPVRTRLVGDGIRQRGAYGDYRRLLIFDRELHFRRRGPAMVRVVVERLVHFKQLAVGDGLTQEGTRHRFLSVSELGSPFP